MKTHLQYRGICGNSFQKQGPAKGERAKPKISIKWASDEATATNNWQKRPETPLRRLDRGRRPKGTFSPRTAANRGEGLHRSRSRYGRTTECVAQTPGTAQTRGNQRPATILPRRHLDRDEPGSVSNDGKHCLRAKGADGWYWRARTTSRSARSISMTTAVLNQPLTKGTSSRGCLATGERHGEPSTSPQSSDQSTTST